MGNDPLTNDVSSRICKHMNQDHAEAVIAYAKYYGGSSKVKKAKMIEINPTRMKLKVDENFIEINFEHRLTDSEDAHKTLVSMLKAIPTNT